MKVFFKCCTVTLLMAFLVSCSTTKVRNSWLNPSFSDSSFQKVLVIGVHKDTGVRSEYESKLAASLKANGINAVSATTIKELRSERNKDKVVEMVKKYNFDSVLVTKYQALKEEEIYKPGYTEYQVIGYRGMFDPFYHQSMIEIQHPGYVIDRETLYLEVSLFETEEGQVVWRGVTASINPAHNNVINDVVEVLSNKMASTKLY